MNLHSGSGLVLSRVDEVIGGALGRVCRKEAKRKKSQR